MKSPGRDSCRHFFISRANLSPGTLIHVFTQQTFTNASFQAVEATTSEQPLVRETVPALEGLTFYVWGQTKQVNIDMNNKISHSNKSYEEKVQKKEKEKVHRGNVLNDLRCACMSGRCCGMDREVVCYDLTSE